MQNKTFYWVGILTFILSGTAQGASTAAVKASSESTVESSAPAQKNWKATATSYYYSFEGTQAAQDNIYSFGKTSLAMQMFTLSYDVAPGWTVMALGEYMDNYVETNMLGMTFKDRTLGFGDTLVDVIHPLYIGSSVMLFGDAGISLPTGSIHKLNPSSAVPGGRYAYNMQMGSGTYDVEAGAVGLYLNQYFQAGTHLSTYQRLGGYNENGYKLGNLYKGDGWLDVPVGYGFTPRLVGYYKVKQAIHGVDPTLGRNIFTEYYHHDQQNWDVSAALQYKHALVGTATIVAEAGKPLTQGSKNSDQVVVSTNYYGTVGVSGTF